MNIVIVGGGFGGIKAAIELAKKQVGTITLISDRGYFLHHGLLYSTAAGNDPRESAIPIREILAPYPDIRFCVDTATKIDAKERIVHGAKKTYRYDQLVLAIGMSEYFYGIDGAKRYSYSLDTLEGVKKFSSDFHDRVIDEGSQLSCAIIGGGPTGVELAGHLCGYVKKITRAHVVNTPRVGIMILEKSKRLLPGFSRTASDKVSRKLRQLGVEVYLNHEIDRVARSYVVADGKRMSVDMAVWTCGGRLNPLFEQHPELFCVSKRGRVVVNQYMSAYSNIFVIGDSAETSRSGTASAAVDHAQFVAAHLWRIQRNTRLRPKRPSTQPLVSLPISRFWAYSERHGLYVSGFLGSMIRRVAELNSYCYFLPIDKAYGLWRRHRNGNEICHLCRQNARNGEKSLAKA